MKLKGKTIECKIEKLVNGGYGLSRYESKVVFVFNALPNETVMASVYKEKRGYAEAVATEIIEASPNRKEPLEAHFLSCSPWQILDFTEENKWKQSITQEMFESIDGQIFDDLPIVSDDLRLHYRNKMEYSFWVEEGTISLAFFKRGQRQKQPIPNCCLATESINLVAERVVAELNRLSVNSFILKTIILRSNRAGEVVAALFVKDEQFPELPHIELDHCLKGFTIYYSNPQSPASVPTNKLSHIGNSHLTETVNGKKLRYDVLSFFQVNVGLFEKVVKQIQPFVMNEDILDYYCGVGAISIALSDHVASCTMVDISEESIENAHENIQINKLSHFTAYCNKAEKILETIVPEKVVIIDPPRAGVHPKVLRALREKQPKRIVYLSCNISTCARDLQQLCEVYDVVFKEIYNFFPATPHIEFLCVLERK